MPEVINQETPSQAVAIDLEPQPFHAPAPVKGLVNKIDTLNPAVILKQMMDSGIRYDPTIVTDMMEKQKTWKADLAKDMWNLAFSAWKANPPEVFKSKHVSYTTDKGTTDYDHADLGDIAAQVNASMAPYGLSFTWRSEQDHKGGIITVYCVIRHAAGHEESTSLTGGYDKTGGKNSMQALGSAATYLQRYTLVQATGIVPKGFLPEDDDGRGVEIGVISDEQAQELREVLANLGKSEEEFIERVIRNKPAMRDVESIDQIPVAAFEGLCKYLGRMKSHLNPEQQQ